MNQNEFNPNEKAASTFRLMFGSAEQSPIGGYAGKSHFGYVQPINPISQNSGWHITTEVPGMEQKTCIPIHNYLNVFKY